MIRAILTSMALGLAVSAAAEPWDVSEHLTEQAERIPARQLRPPDGELTVTTLQRKVFLRGSGSAVTKPSVWNPAWDGVDLTGIAWNRREGGALVGRRHYVTADHFPIPRASVLLFTDRTGKSHPARIRASRTVPGTDIRAYLLTADVPAQIGHYGMVSPGRVYELRNGVVISTAFNGRDGEWGSKIAGFKAAGRTFGHEPPPERHGYIEIRGWTQAGAPRWLREWAWSPTRGDSGHPTFCVVNGRTVLLSTWTTSTAGPYFWGRPVQEQLWQTFGKLEAEEEANR